MRIQAIIRASAAAALLILLAGCSGIPIPGKAPHKPEHTGAAAFSSIGEGASLGYIEFDDQGELWSRQQLATVTDGLRKLAARGPVKLIIYAHGWSNSAREGALGDNLSQFKQLISSLAEVSSKENATYPYQIAGVYLGWRGHLMERRIAVDIWDRLQAAQRIGGLSGTEAVTDLALTVRRHPGSRVLLTGHSLGTVIAENAANRVLLSRALEVKHGLAASSRPPFDVVLLVNSAQSSLPPHQMIAGLKSQRVDYITPRNEDVPLIVSLTAKDDWLTSFLFPLSVTIARLNPLNTQASGELRGAYRDGPDGDTGDTGRQRQTHTTPGAHNPAIVSHEMTVLGPARPTAGPEGGKEEMTQLILDNFAPGAATAGTYKDWEKNGIFVRGDTHDFLLKRAAGAWNDTPYWVCRTPPELFSGHSGFWENKNIVALTAALLRINQSGAQLKVRR